jgi:hypothetical protein
MMFEQFDPKVTPEPNKFKDQYKCETWLNAVTAENSQYDVLIVRLSTIWRILIEDSEQNQELSILPSQSARQIRNNYSNIKVEGLVFESIKHDSGFLANLEYLTEERRQVNNMFPKLIKARNLKADDRSDSELQDINEELLWLMQEYYRLSSLPNLTESDTKQMLLILELAQIDPQLDDLINQIDAAIAEETGLMKAISTTDNSAIKKFKDYFIKYLEQKLISSKDVE